MDRGQKFIAGGNMLFSKRPDRFLPERWPGYFKKAKGCHVYDLDNNKYTDMTIMGVGTNILDMQINMWTIHSLQGLKGNMTTLNCIEEVDLAKKLVTMHPWADKIDLQDLEVKQIRLQLDLRELQQKTKHCLLWVSWLA